jgi:predicted methyltransferase
MTRCFSLRTLLSIVSAVAALSITTRAAEVQPDLSRRGHLPGRPLVTQPPQQQQQRQQSQQPQSGNNESHRESWQRVPDVIAALGIAPGSRVADVGAGDGFFTTRLANAVGADGRVYAVDISKNALDRLSRRIADAGLTNVDAILSTPSDPRLPAGMLDAALIVNAYHEMREHQAMLAAIKAALKPGGRLVILESVMNGQRNLARDVQENRHQLAPHFVQQDALQAGFSIVRFDEAFTRAGTVSPEYLLVLTPIDRREAWEPGSSEGWSWSREPGSSELNN